jgi:hypothetical protein
MYAKVRSQAMRRAKSEKISTQRAQSSQRREKREQIRFAGSLCEISSRKIFSIFSALFSL